MPIDFWTVGFRKQLITTEKGWPDHDLWRDFPYKYEDDSLAIDLINSGGILRQGVNDLAAIPAELETFAATDEASWSDERSAVVLYP